MHRKRPPAPSASLCAARHFPSRMSFHSCLLSSDISNLAACVSWETKCSVAASDGAETSIPLYASSRDQDSIRETSGIDGDGDKHKEPEAPRDIPDLGAKCSSNLFSMYLTSPTTS
eukprot:Skav209394  [mRNA]  locus=scaffold962:8749:11275:+ [translate_table: standard]